MSRFSILLLIVILYFVNSVQGYVYKGATDTKEGYCNLVEQGFGRVAVGKIGYNNVNCEKIMCSEGEFAVHGCGRVMYDQKKCRLVPGSGKYPKCCPQVRCK